MTSTEYALGPSAGHVQLRTTREGVAAKVGHDLVIDFPRWTGTLTLDPDDPGNATLTAEVELASFTVVDGTGGVTPLSTNDKAEITKTALKLLDVERNPTATFTAERVVAQDDEHASIEGHLTLHGKTGPVRLEVSESGKTSWHAMGSVKQSDFGIKPYKAFLGALRLADTVGLDVTVELGESPG